jgi:hypothetical protein
MEGMLLLKLLKPLLLQLLQFQLLLVQLVLLAPDVCLLDSQVVILRVK